MKDRNIGSWIGNACATVFTALQTDTIFQIISGVLTVISILVSLSFSIYNWHKEAKKDGKISKEELAELIQIAKDKGEELEDVLNQFVEEDKNGK